MNKEKDLERTSHTKKLDEVIRKKRTESDALKKLMKSLEKSDVKKTKN